MVVIAQMTIPITARIYLGYIVRWMDDMMVEILHHLHILIRLCLPATPPHPRFTMDDGP